MTIPGDCLPVQGHCPMGCGDQLGCTQQGVIMCFSPSCPEPAAVTQILADPETGHIVVLGDDSFSVKHPLRERLNDGLLSCAVGEYVADEGPYVPWERGHWRVTGDGPPPSWTWERP